MRTLVIHPTDGSTDFLNVIYQRKGYDIINFNASKSLLKKAIKKHDRIITMCHDTEEWLIGHGRFIINSEFVYLFREKSCIFIWCNADKFVEKYKLKSELFTGMIISEDMEANLFCINASYAQIEEFNKLFSESIRNCIGDELIQIKDIKGLYMSSSNPIINFNRNNIFSNLK